MFMSLNKKNSTIFANGDALIWLEEELVYGDWTSGVNGDGSYEKKTNLAISEVCHCNFFTNWRY